MDSECATVCSSAGTPAREETCMCRYVVRISLQKNETSILAKMPITSDCFANTKTLHDNEAGRIAERVRPIFVRTNVSLDSSIKVCTQYRYSPGGTLRVISVSFFLPLEARLVSFVSRPPSSLQAVLLVPPGI